MKKQDVMAAVCSIFLLCPWTVTAAQEAVFLNNDKNIPYAGMVKETRVYMKISSITLEDIFKDGFAVQAEVIREKEGKYTSATVHFRMADDSSAWVWRSDGWHEITKASGDAEREIIRLIREDMGKENHRKAYVARIAELWDQKTKEQEEAMKEEMEEKEPEKVEDVKVNYKPVELSTVVPAHVVVALDTRGKEDKADEKKEKGDKKITKEEKTRPEQVEIVIHEHPVVEIVSEEP